MIDLTDDQHDEVIKLADWLLSLAPFAQKHELGQIQALLEDAVAGLLVPSTDATAKIVPVRMDPDIYELRHQALSKKLRFYHGEPSSHPDAMIRLHEHIKIDKPHQDQQIKYAVERYRKEIN